MDNLLSSAFFVLWIEYENKQKEKKKRILSIIRLQRKKGLNNMNEAIKSFIGKELFSINSW